MWKVKWSSKSLHELKKLDKSDRVLVQRIYNRVQEAQNEPYEMVERLSKSKHYKIRIGDYRAILDIQQKNLTVYVVMIGHRNDIYQRMQSN